MEVSEALARELCCCLVIVVILVFIGMIVIVKFSSFQQAQTLHTYIFLSI